MHHIAILFVRILSPALGVLLGVLGFATLSENLLGWFLFIAGVLYAAGAVIAAYILRRNFWEAQATGLVTHVGSGDRSFWWLTAGMAAVSYLSPLEFLYLRTGSSATSWFELAGVCLALLGVLLFLWARGNRQGQLLKATGPYRFLRHPDYAGYVLAGLGLSIGYASLWGAAAMLLILLPAVLWRIRLEERLLRASFGEQFIEYASRTSRLIPGVW